MLTTLLGYMLLGVFTVSERFLRQGEEARSFETAASDQGTTRLVGAAWALWRRCSLGLAQVASPIRVCRSSGLY